MIQWAFPLCTSRPDLWEDSQITRCVLFGPGQTRRYGLSCLQLSCQQPINYCVFSPPRGLSVCIYFKVLLKIVASNLFALISQRAWVIADSLCSRPPWVLKRAPRLHTTLLYPGKVPLETEMGRLFFPNLSGHQEGKTEVSFIGDTSPPMLISGSPFGCVSKIILSNRLLGSRWEICLSH